MNLSISTAHRPALIALACTLLILAWTYIAGGILLVAFDREITDATPLTLYQYWYWHGDNQRVQDGLFIACIVASLICFALMKIIFAPAKKSLYGEARFASRKEIEQAGLFGEQGVIVGKLGGRFLMFGGQQHAIISAPTRSGKGVGIVVPNLLSWPDSVVVLDIKQENWDITSAYRKKHGHQCYLFNPVAADYRTHRYNPLAYISDDPNFRIDDIQQIANMLFPDKPGMDTIWTATPRTLFLGIVLYLLETPGRPVTLGQVLRETLAEGDGAAYFARVIYMRALAARIKDTPNTEAVKQAEADLAIVLSDNKTQSLLHPHLTEMAMWYHVSASYRKTLTARNRARQKADPTTPDIAEALKNASFDKEAAKIAKRLSETCVNALKSYISITAEKTRGGVIAGMRSTLELWMNPLVDAATSANDFDLREIRKQKISIYVGVTPNNLERVTPLLNLFFQQLIDLNTRERPEQNSAIKHPCLLLMDEFASLGKISVLSKGIAYIAGYWLRMLPVIQSPSQLVEVYGMHAAETFTTNHALNVIYPPKATETRIAREISEWLGYQTVKGKSESKGKGLFAKKSKSESSSDQRRALLLPQEITGLGQRRELVVMENTPPIAATKVVFYKDKVFLDRLKQVSPSLRALGSRKPKEAQLRSAVAKGELRANVPAINVTTANPITAGLPIAPPVRQTGPGTETVEHVVTILDMPKLSETKLHEYGIKWKDKAAPQPGDTNEETLGRYTQDLMDSVPLRTLS